MEETTQAPTTTSVGLKYGGIYALVIISSIVIQAALGINPYESKFDAFFFIGILLALAIIYFAHREYKNEGDGYMSYGQGLGIGMIIGVIGSVALILFTYIYLTFVDTSLWDPIFAKAIEDMEKRGASDEDIEKGRGLIKLFFWVFMTIFALFFNFVYALIVSIFTSKSRPETF